MFSTLLAEYKTDSFIKMLNENSKHKANMKSKRNNEESKGESDKDESEDIFDQNFKVYAVDYLCEEKIGQLLENIKIVCRRY